MPVREIARVVGRFIQLSIGLLLLSVNAHAEIYRCTGSDGKMTFQQQPCTVSRTKPGDAKKPARNITRHMLWRATSNDSTLYILGSLPFGDSSLYPLDEAIAHAYAEADALAVEQSLFSDQNPSLKEQLRHHIYLSGGQRLRNLLKESDRNQLRRVAAKQGVDLRDIELLQPWYAALLFSHKASLSAGYSQEFAIDRYLTTQASNSKPVLLLTKSDELIRRYSELPRDQQVLLLLKTLDDLDTDIPYFDKLLSAWRKGQSGSLETFLNGRFLSVPALQTLYRKLLVERNERLAALLDRMLGDRLTYLAIIDTALLLGEEGVINQLKRRGYVVEQR